ncbi:hypothetical protein DFH07DRAFT_1029595 [Mycena maculata]|uniref:Uncharacterized protein n=1 Tax=Mycena maculata TaxID=230809 RepID=A0AAD7J008_9AGAR|nr:hypothetical protein DFH07DRAFT_1029595 [Mycena maculata]
MPPSAVVMELYVTLTWRFSSSQHIAMWAQIRSLGVSTGSAYTINGPLISAIAYLQTGACLFNGEGQEASDLSRSDTDLFDGVPKSGHPRLSYCSPLGEGCTTVETTLQNPTTPGSGSSTDLTLIAPHAFSVTTGFGYYNGRDNTGADCTSASCTTAFHVSGDTGVQVACQTDNVDLVITFCD